MGNRMRDAGCRMQEAHPCTADSAVAMADLQQICLAAKPNFDCREPACEFVSIWEKYEGLLQIVLK